MSDDVTTPEVSLPFWFSGSEVSKLASAAVTWFQRLMEWAMWPAQQMDPEACGVRVLKLIAWQRDIDRFSGEPLSLFRLRVKYAYANAKDAGSIVGFKRIFERLGIGYVELDERMEDRDWDVIGVRLQDTQIAENQELLTEIIQHYGRTCRRYEWTVITPLTVAMRAGGFDMDYQTVYAKVPSLLVRTTAHTFDNDSSVLTAKL